jgi:hypothetical protein
VRAAGIEIARADRYGVMVAMQGRAVG